MRFGIWKVRSLYRSGSLTAAARELARYKLDSVGVRRWEDHIKMDFQDVGCEGMDWIDLAQERDRWQALVNAVINLRVTYNAGNFLIT
jgi:hypothetical protein